MRTVSNDSPLTFITSQTTPKAVSPLKTKINPMGMTSPTHLNLPNGSLSAAPSTHTTMPAIEWLRLRELKLKRKRSIGKLETWITSRTQVTTSWKLSSHGEAYARCSTNHNPSTPIIEITG